MSIVVAMETLKVQMKEKKAKAVREIAMKKFGFAKGSISKAFNDAIDEWIKKQTIVKKTKKPDWDSITGAIKEIKMSSVELQHKAFQLDNQKDRHW